MSSSSLPELFPATATFSSKNRVKLLAVLAATALVVLVGVVVLNKSESSQITALEHAQAIANAANTPLSQLPQESAVETPEGWEIESDQLVEDGITSDQDEESEQVNEDLEQDGVEEDDDIDSPLRIEEDTGGEQFVAELSPDVIVDGNENEETSQQVVAEDARRGSHKCYKNLKTCGAKKSCSRKCIKKCKPYAIRQCRPRKFCRCFCKHYGKIKAAKKCVVYQKLLCKHWRVFRCRRNCKKFCKKVPHCYCCPKTHIRRKCRQMCKRAMFRSKCARCRCLKLKCYKSCRFVCVKKYKK